MRKVLLDANLLIAAFDEHGSTSESERTQAKETIGTLVGDEQVRLVITPLIRYETLRGITWGNSERYEQLKQILDGIQELDVNRDIAELAANLFRFDRATVSNPTQNIDKRRFDAFHLASAKCYGLELASHDSDIAGLENLYQRYKFMSDIRNENQP